MGNANRTFMICPNANCGYKGLVEAKAKGNRVLLYTPVILTFGLMIMFYTLADRATAGGKTAHTLTLLGGACASLLGIVLLIAIIYCVTHHGDQTVCPKCGNRIK
jgi:hypothetical protein